MFKRDFLLVGLINNLYSAYGMFVDIFGVIFFYQISGYNIFLALVPFVVGHMYYAIFVNYSTKISGILGTRIALIISFFLFVVASVPMIIYRDTPATELIWVWVLLYYTAKLFFHPSMIYITGRNTNHTDRGTQFSFLQISYTITKLITPIVGGFTAAYFGLTSPFIAASAIMLLALIPGVMLPNDKFRVHVDFVKAIRSPRAGKQAVVNIWAHIRATGLWAILLFLLVDSTVSNLGVTITVASLFSMILSYLFGKFINRHRRKTSYSIAIGLNGVADILQGGLAYLISPIFLDLGGRFSDSLRSEIVDVVNYDLTTDDLREELQDELIVTREIVIDSTISITIFSLALVATVFGLQTALILAGILKLFGAYSVYREDQ